MSYELGTCMVCTKHTYISKAGICHVCQPEEVKEQIGRGETVKTVLKTILVVTLLVAGIYALSLLTALCRPAHASEGMATYYTAASTKAEGTSGIFTANGERYDEKAMTCALRRRDFGKEYIVYGHSKEKGALVRHNDFGPGEIPTYEKGVIIDLSPAAFKEVCGDLSIGKCKVSVQEVK